MGGQVTDGKNSTMRYLISSLVVILGITVNAKDVFRYVDEETGDSHYMTGDPGKSVEGGWSFTNADGTYELVYKADEGGLQPEAEHIPVAVEDTNEVAEAKANFYTLFKEHEAKVQEALENDEAVAEIEETMVEKDDEAKSEEKMVYAHGQLFGQPLHYSFHPYLGFVPNVVTSGEKADETMVEEGEVTEYKFVPYFGFVPANDEKTDDEEKGDDGVRYKFDPLYGFVQVKKEGGEEVDASVEPMEEQEYKYVPYIGFVPLTAEDKESEEEIVSYKFNPFYGFVQATPEKKEEMDLEDVKYKFVPYYGFVPVGSSEKTAMEDEDVEEGDKDVQDHHLQYVFHPYHGYLPTLVQKPEVTKMPEQLFTFDKMGGFVPVEPMEEETEAEEAEEVRRKKREAQLLLYPNYNYPRYVQYAPSYVVQQPASIGAKKAEVAAEEKPETLPAVVDSQKVPLPGLVQVQLVQTPVLQAAQPLVVVQQPALPLLPADQYPVIPNDPEQDQQGAFEF